MTPSPRIDVIIAVHDTSRPIRRAVESALADSDGAARVTVVCHGLSADQVRGSVGDFTGESPRYIEHVDGVPSPAGPFNAGLDASDAEFVALMGSDDFLEPGAVRSWADYITSENPDIALMPLRHQSGEKITAPLRRWGHARHLNSSKDRLFYRSAPLGLLRRELVQSLGARLTPRMRTGEDLEMSSRLWASDARIDYMVGAPAYVIGADAADRVSMTKTSLRTQLEPVERLVASDWFASAARDVRLSLAVKLMRINIVGIIRSRTEPEEWSREDIQSMKAIIRRLCEIDSQVLDNFSVADRRFIEGFVAAARAHEVLDSIRNRAHASWLSTVITRNPIALLGRESVLTRYLLYRVLR